MHGCDTELIRNNVSFVILSADEEQKFNMKIIIEMNRKLLSCIWYNVELLREQDCLEHFHLALFSYIMPN